MVFISTTNSQLAYFLFNDIYIIIHSLYHPQEVSELYFAKVTYRILSNLIRTYGSTMVKIKIVTWWRITIQLWVMTASLMNNKLQILYIINKIINYCIVLTARTAALSFFQNSAHDCESNPHAILSRISFFSPLETVKRVRIRFENIRQFLYYNFIKNHPIRIFMWWLFIKCSLCDFL